MGCNGYYEFRGRVFEMTLERMVVMQLRADLGFYPIENQRRYRKLKRVM